MEYRLGETTIYNIIVETCDIIFEQLSPIYLRQPTAEKWKNISEGFWKHWQMPNCIGAIDGKHVQIKCPPNSGSVYYNYKKTFSVILLAVCDYKYEFTLFDVGAVGGESDGGVLVRSELGKALRENRLNIPQEMKALPGSIKQTPHYFVADDAFQLGPSIMKPYSGHNLEEKKTIFNYRLSRARRIIENSFGILVNRWLFLSKSTGLNPDSTVKCVLAAICLHNYLMKYTNDSRLSYGQELSRFEESERTQNFENQRFNEATVLNNIDTINLQMCAQNGNSVRNTLSDYFLTKEGEVRWQYDYVRRS